MTPATHTWTGATSSFWSDPTNWKGGSPANDNGAQLVFPAGAMHLATTNDLAFNPRVEIQSMTFMGSDNYTLSGNAVQLAGGIILDSTATTGADVINLPIVLGATQTWTVTNASRTLQVGGIISGAFAGSNPPGLTKDGAGTLILTANNVYSGTTTVAAGSLLVNGSQPLSNVVVDGAAALEGSGTVGTITTSGLLSPGGPGPGVLHSGNIVFNAGSSLVMEFTGTAAGTGFSALVVNGTVNLSGSPTLSLTLGGFIPTVGNTFAIISSTGPVTGAFDGLPDNSTLTVGGRKFLIHYAGATELGGNGVVVTAGTENTQTYVSSSLNPSPSGQAVTFTATVTPVVPLRTLNPMGIATFLDGTSTLGTATLSPAGTASFTTPTALTAGPHSITAIYSGDMNFTTSTSAPLVQMVNPALATTISLTSSPNPSVFSQPITLTATVMAVPPATGTPSGTVAFNDGATTLGTGTLDGNGRASFQTSTLAVGAHLFTATYNGSTSFAASTTTSPLTQSIIADPTTTTLASALNPSVAGQLVTFMATVSAGGPGSPGEGSSVSPGGTVQFQIDGADFGSPVTLSSGAASSGPITSLSVGNHTVSAIYSGDANFSTSAGTLIQTVNRANTDTTITASADLAGAGLPITFTVLVQAEPPGAGAPTGIVTFRDGTSTLGTANINSAGTATLTLATGAGANHSVRVDYSGDANFNSSTSSTSPPQDFVTALYEDVLQRPPDTSGLNFWVQQLETGATRAAVAMVFENSAESLGLEVDSIYQTYLKRPADAAGRAVWLNALLNGESEASVIAAFVTSAEYTASHPSDGDYVSGLYQDIFGRPADAAGLADWLQVLQFRLAGRAQVALSFLNSPEAYLQAVNYDYTHFLKRSPDAAGQQTALTALQSGRVTPREMSILFLASDEYFAKAVTM